MKRSTLTHIAMLVTSCLPVATIVTPSHAEVRFGGEVTGLTTNDFEAYTAWANRPGTALTLLDDAELRIAFGEKLVGQVTTVDGDFDVISGTPTVPLTLDGSVDENVGIVLLSVARSSVGIGLGPDGFPWATGIGEGALTVLYAVDQRVIGFDVVGADGGALRMQFFNRLGEQIGDLTVENLANSTYVFSSDVWNIAAITFTNTDLSGVGFDNFLYSLTGSNAGPPGCDVPESVFFDQPGPLVELALDAGAVEDPDGTSWVYSWITDCPNSYFDDNTLPDPILVVDTSLVCSLECSAVVIVNDGYDSDVCTTNLVIENGVPATVTCPADLTVEADGAWNVGALEAWLGSVVAGGGQAVNDFAGLEPGCGMTGSATVTWTVIPDDDCGAPASCSATFTIVDTISPVLDVETVALTVDDIDCDGEEPVTLPVVTAIDAGGASVTLTNDAPPLFPAGETTTVTFTAVDDCGNSSTTSVDVTVLHGAGIEATVIRRRAPTPGFGRVDEPVVGLLVAAYESSRGSCADQLLREHHPLSNAAPFIAAECEPANMGVTDEDGVVLLDVPPGRYVFVAHVDSDGDGVPDEFVAQSVGMLPCGQWKARELLLNGRGRPKK
jgi:hypothetical protein